MSSDGNSAGGGGGGGGSSSSSRRMVRLRSEIAQLTKHPSPGLRVYFEDECEVTEMKVEMTGPDNSPFAGRTLTLKVSVPERYPFEPPLVQFASGGVYHPNVDPTGRICLQALKPKPTGSWNVTLNIVTVLASIRVLLGEPNLDDPLMPEIAHEFATNHEAYCVKVKQAAADAAAAASTGAADAAAAS